MSYYKTPEHVIFFSPMIRFLSKVTSPKYFIIRCEVCGKIPTELYGKFCLKHKK